MPRGCARRNELRLHNRLQRQHELFDLQVHRVLSVSVFIRQGPGGIEYDIDARGLPSDTVDARLNDFLIQGVNDRCMGAASSRRDLPGDFVHVRLRPSGHKEFRPFSRKFFGNGSANRASCAEHDRALSLRDCHGSLSFYGISSQSFEDRRQRSYLYSVLAVRLSLSPP
jgi:hypothetical protein